MSKFHQINRTFGPGEAREIPDVPPVVEIHCTADPAFTKVYGRKVKRMGGKYDDVRGNQETRFVHVPTKKPGAIELINRIVEDFGKVTYYGGVKKNGKPKVTMIARGATGNGPAWLDVHHVPRRVEDREGGTAVFEEFVALYHRALEQAAERKIAGIGKGPIPESFYAERAAKQREQLEGRIAYHKEALAKAEAELAELNKTTPKPPKKKTETLTKVG